MKEFNVSIKGTLTVTAKDKDDVRNKLLDRLLWIAYEEDFDTIEITKIKEKKG